jgi:hypothetical protein
MTPSIVALSTPHTTLTRFFRIVLWIQVARWYERGDIAVRPPTALVGAQAVRLHGVPGPTRTMACALLALTHLNGAVAAAASPVGQRQHPEKAGAGVVAGGGSLAPAPAPGPGPGLAPAGGWGGGGAGAGCDSVHQPALARGIQLAIEALGPDAWAACQQVGRCGFGLGVMVWGPAEHVCCVSGVLAGGLESDWVVGVVFDAAGCVAKRWPGNLGQSMRAQEVS